MANISALGGGPISFVDAYGKQYSIPLCFVSYASATGAPVVASSWGGWTLPNANALQTNINGWLSMEATLGFILPAPVPPALPAFTITAVAQGSTGNDITIAFNSQNTDGSLNVTVSTTQFYPGLNFTSGDPQNIETVLGTTAGGGSEPGLAFVSTPPAGATPLPTATTGAVGFSLVGADYVFDLPGTAAVLTASDDTTDAQHITATIGNIQSGPSTFDLTLSWSKTVTNVTPATLGSNFSYLISVAAPPAGFGAIPPVPSSITLVGGADTSSSAAAKATATVISS